MLELAVHRVNMLISLALVGMFACGGAPPVPEPAAEAATPAATPARPVGPTEPHARERAPVGPVAFAERIEHEGVALEVEVAPLVAGRTELMAYEGARVRISMHDTAGGTPIAGSFPAGWLQPREGGEAPDARACGKLVEGFVSGSLFNQPEVDLNTFTVLVLNGDNTINVVDPRFGFGGSKLLTTIPIGGPGYDWVLRSDQSELFVSVPDAGEIAIIETYGYRPVAQVKVGEAAGRLRLQADEHYLWTAGGKQLVAVAIDERQVAARLDIGDGEHDVAISTDSRYVFVSDASANTVTVVDARTLSIHGVIETGWQPVSLDYSSAANALFVAERGEGAISIIDPIGPTLAGRIQAEAGLGELRFAPNGRFGFVVNPRQDLLHVFDAASRRMLQTGEVQSGPDHVAFTKELAFLRHAGSDTIYMLNLGEVGQEGVPLQIVDFPAGQHPLGPRSSPAATIMRAPGGGAVLIAHPVDRAVYYYKQGMAAPMGQFSNYNQMARAVLTVDRSLKEVESRGVYETSAMLGKPGIYDFAVFVDSPRIMHCFEVEVAENPERERELGPPVAIEWLLPQDLVTVGAALEVGVKLHDRRTDTALEQLDDVVISLTTMMRGNWNARELGVVRDGVYRATFTPQLPGVHQLRVTSARAGLKAEHNPDSRVVVRGQ